MGKGNVNGDDDDVKNKAVAAVIAAAAAGDDGDDAAGEDGKAPEVGREEPGNGVHGEEEE